MKKILLSLSLLLLAGAAQADRAEDREAINELMWRYARALDTLNADAYVAVFTQDGQFGSGNMATQGHDALRKMVEDLKAGREEREAAGEPPAPMYHMTTDSWIEFVDEDRARHHSYWLTAFGPAGAGGTPRIAAVGRGVDDLVKRDGKWLIERRDVAPQDE